MRVFKGVDEVRAAVGTHVGWSDWHEITQAQVDLFAEATGDHQWIHVDPDRAKQGPFGSTIAHGYLTLSITPKLVWEVMRVDGLSMELNYGANKVRFPAPAPVGSRVRAGVEILSLEEAALGYQCAFRITVEIEGGSKPACVVESLGYMVP